MSLSRITFNILITIAVLLLTLPLIILALRGITTLTHFRLDPAIIDALRLSTWTSSITMMLVLLLGTPLAYTLARSRFRGRRLLAVLVQLPIVMPPAVAGLALLLTFGRRSIIGTTLDTLSIQIAFTAAAVILAQTFVSLPFYIRAAQAGFMTLNQECEEAARVDGANRWHVWWQITLPLALPNIISGLMLAWARALGEFGATLLFAGNLQGRTQTMPLLVYSIFERDLSAAVHAALLLLAIAILTLFISELFVRSLPTD